MTTFNSIIGQSPAFESLLRSAQVIAVTDVTLLIKGETGTGKEVMANAIQQGSPRAKKPFITLNCAALPENLVESELFGHKKGAFTGAINNKKGLLQVANGGTLFLDEINSLPLAIQAKLLRFLESGECLAVGETKPYTSDVRIIAATNTDLLTQIDEGKFRQDLFFRLSVVPLEIPPLRQRTEDIEALSQHFFKEFSERYSVAESQFSKQAIRKLRHYDWPGNIRELRNLCERLSILLPGTTIEAENLPIEFIGKISNDDKMDKFILPENGLRLENLEANIIHQALTRTKGNRSKSARLLGISRDTLLYRIQKYGLSTH